jgi:hypothetical protein
LLTFYGDFQPFPVHSVPDSVPGGGVSSRPGCRPQWKPIEEHLPRAFVQAVLAHITRYDAIILCPVRHRLRDRTWPRLRLRHRCPCQGRRLPRRDRPPRVLESARHVLGPDLNLSSLNARSVNPAGGAQPLPTCPTGLRPPGRIRAGFGELAVLPRITVAGLAQGAQAGRRPGRLRRGATHSVVDPRAVHSGLNRRASALAVYASWGGSPHRAPQDSLPGAGQALPGGIGYPQGPDERFQRRSRYTSSLLSQASWRKRCPLYVHFQLFCHTGGRVVRRADVPLFLSLIRGPVPPVTFRLAHLSLPPPYAPTVRVTSVGS